MGKNFDIQRHPARAIYYPGKQMISLALAGISSAIFQLLGLKFAESIFGPYHETFAMVLGITLLGIALGSLIIRLFKFSFSAVLRINIIYFALFLIMFFPLLKLYSLYFTVFQPFNPVLWKLFILFLIMGTGSICFGAAIPSLIHQESHIAKESGHLLFISSIANVTGYLLMVFIIHPGFKYGDSLLIILTLLILSQLIISKKKIRSLLISSIILITASVLKVHFWNEDLLYINYKSFHNIKHLYTSLLNFEEVNRFRKFNEHFAVNKVNGRAFFFINGYTSHNLDSPNENIVAVLSSLAAPKLQDALVLGLGSGQTAGTAAEMFDKTDIVEISPIIIAKQDLLKEYNFGISYNPKTTIICDDAIRYVKTTVQKYDLVLNTVTSPLYFSSSKLYTCDFFRDVKKILKKNGIYTTWLDSRIGDNGTRIILKSLQKEFKYCWISLIGYDYFLFLCSNEPISIKQAFPVFSNSRLKDFFIKNHGIDIRSIRYAYICTDAYRCLPKKSAIPINTIDFPALEFEISSFSNVNITKFENCIINEYSFDKAKKEFFTDDSFDIYALLLYFYQQISPEFLMTKKLFDSASKKIPDINEKLKSHIIDHYIYISEKYPNASNLMKVARWLNFYKYTDLTTQYLWKVFEYEPGYHKIRFILAQNLYSRGELDKST
ncbi:hypothetical protein ACFLTD_01365 [Elusimicrobiota bacterium]